MSSATMTGWKQCGHSLDMTIWFYSKTKSCWCFENYHKKNDVMLMNSN